MGNKCKKCYLIISLVLCNKDNEINREEKNKIICTCLCSNAYINIE